MNIKKITALLLCLILAFSSVSCSVAPKEPKTQARSYYEYFDTVSVIFSYAGDSEAEFAANCEAASALLGEYHELFDIYYEYAGVNNLMTVNKNAGIAPVPVDERLIDFLLYAKEMHALTKGAVNVAMGAVLRLWHDAREDASDDPENAYIPSAQDLAEAANHTDIDKLIIDREAGTVYLEDPEMSLDVGALGKGYATEKAAQLLMERGAVSYVLNIGGNIRAMGEKVTGEGWTTGITNPDKSSDESFVCRVVIKDSSLVTSGNYERFYTVDGKRYHHIIDPATNMPAEYFSSISVFTRDSGLADALSTALFCMSYEDGARLIDSLEGVDALWVSHDGSLKFTQGVVFVTQ